MFTREYLPTMSEQVAEQFYLLAGHYNYLVVHLERHIRFIHHNPLENDAILAFLPYSLIAFSP
jgi:hypothetical protein